MALSTQTAVRQLPSSAATVPRRNTVMVGESSLNGSMGLVVRGQVLTDRLPARFVRCGQCQKCAAQPVTVKKIQVLTNDLTAPPNEAKKSLSPPGVWLQYRSQTPPPPF